MSTGSITGSLAAQAQESLLQAREQNMLHQLQSAQGGKSDTKLSDTKIEKSAKEFESMLLSNWLQQAEQSMASVPGSDDDEDAGARNQMMSLGVQSLATAMTNSGGIGIAAMISKALHSAADSQKPGAAQAGGAELKKLVK
jgi:Rod binding domain-containing protein